MLGIDQLVLKLNDCIAFMKQFKVICRKLKDIYNIKHRTIFNFFLNVTFLFKVKCDIN